MLLVALMLGVATLSARQIGDRYQGSAPALEGKIYVLICFVSETEWDENEMADYCGLIFEAEDWLVSQAKNYGKEVSFKNAYRGFSKPLKCCTSVDLPDPVCPIIPINSPFSICRLTSSSATVLRALPSE